MSARRAVSSHTHAVRSVLACSAGYFLFALATAVVARGLDMDQLSSRSALAEAAAALSRLLWAPHDAAGRALGGEVLRMRGVIPGLILANTLAWGVAIHAVLRLVARSRRRM